VHRKAILITLSVMLCFSGAKATPTLPPGKPAGLKKAQGATSGAIAVGALAVIAIGGFAISAHPYKIPGMTASTSTQP
jgi:hypothetical protein